jgi:hypothetical protein
MTEKRTTTEYHFGKKWICTVIPIGERYVKAMIRLASMQKGETPAYIGIGGFKYKKDFDFDAAASAAIRSALNKAGYYTLEY